MKITIEYDDPEEARRALDSHLPLAVLRDFSSLLRNKWKYGDGNDDPLSWEEVRDAFHDLLNEHEVTLD